MIDFILGSILLMGGMALLAYVWVCRQKLRASEAWIPATGQVRHAGTETVPSWFGWTWHRARVIYDYGVGGRIFRNDVVLLGGELAVPWRKWAFEHCRFYVATAPVRVWVDPSNPRSACLERRGEHSLFAAALGLAFMTLGAVALGVSA